MPLDFRPGDEQARQQECKRQDSLKGPFPLSPGDDAKPDRSEHAQDPTQAGTESMTGQALGKRGPICDRKGMTRFRRMERRFDVRLDPIAVPIAKR